MLCSLKRDGLLFFAFLRHFYRVFAAGESSLGFQVAFGSECTELESTIKKSRKMMEKQARAGTDNR